MRYRSIYLRACSPYKSNRVCIRQRQNMDALAETWFSSGQRSDDLYKGKIEEITKEFKEWIKARLVRNQAIILLLWDFFKTNDAIFSLREKYGSLQDVRIAPFKARYVKNIERVKVRQFHFFEIARTEPASQEAKEDRDRQYVRALFLIATLAHRGFNWPGMPFTSKWSEIDSEVCAFLRSQDRRFAAEKQLKVLEMQEDFEKWHLEHARRAAEEAFDIAENHAEDDSLTPDLRPTASVSFTIQGRISGDVKEDQLPDPLDVTDLIPPPRLHSKVIPTDALSTISEGTGEEDSESEELPKTISERLNRVLNIEETPKIEKKSKTKIRNAQRRKAKARAKEASKTSSLTDDDGNGPQQSTINDQV